MKKEVFSIWPADETVTLTVYRPEALPERAPALIVIPGGGYAISADREADPVAEHFARRGYLGCVLRSSVLYRSREAMEGPVNPHTLFPEPLRELAETVRFLREGAEDFGISREKIAVMGFSAGGHLAANYANYWAGGEAEGLEGYDPEEIRPNACVLCYAATCLSRERPSPMLRAIFGEKEITDAELKRYSAAENVNAHTPPTFLWHTADDNMVPVSQTTELAAALLERGVACELHVFQAGPHASALAAGLPAEPWSDLADAFLRRVFNTNP